MQSHRAYEGTRDLQAMIDLLLAVRPPDRVADWPGVVELQEVMQRPAVTANTRLWFEGEKLRAWAFLDEWTNLHFLGQPPLDAWAPAMFEWATEIAAGRARLDQDVTLGASAAESDTER